ncbi:rhodanese-like domain-containing protein 4A, chloroplastic isoform X2 [Silene latifolia]|uniref:rhodanese-like domain-containing protein 4A, chloroplastic isoform X2 n=1 Tax=Silene latifolia TaxID=37657 RepID=UPI003D76A524
MASLSLCLSSSSPLLKPNKALENPLQIPLSTSSNQISSNVTALKSHLSFPILMGFLSCSSSLPSLAAEIEDPSSQKINLETTLVTIDEFFNKYPYFVAGVTFIWLIGLPLLQEYLNKYKFISALDAFKKLRDDSSAQLLDIRDDKSVGFLASPNLKIFNKRVLQLPFNESDQAGFLNKVESNFVDPQNTVVCILDKKFRKNSFHRPCTFSEGRKLKSHRNIKRMVLRVSQIRSKSLLRVLIYYELKAFSFIFCLCLCYIHLYMW